MSLMRTLCLLVVLALPTTPVLAGETLPDSAPSGGDTQHSMDGRFRSPAMGTEEMQQLYLQSPVELGNTQEEGLRSVNDQDLYSETDLLQRERLQSSRNNAPAPPTYYERPPLPELPGSGPKPL